MCYHHKLITLDKQGIMCTMNTGNTISWYQHILFLPKNLVRCIHLIVANVETTYKISGNLLIIHYIEITWTIIFISDTSRTFQ